MEDETNSYLLNALEFGKAYKFSAWSNKNNTIPKICAGVYTIWQDRLLIYVGMSGRSLSAELIQEHRNGNSKAKGLFTRLKDHASGRRSGDQFCVYVGDLLVLPTLTRSQIEEIANRRLSFDRLIKNYIHNFFTYRFVETQSGEQAFHLEDAIKRGGLKSGKPLLNPYN